MTAFFHDVPIRPGALADAIRRDPGAEAAAVARFNDLPGSSDGLSLRVWRGVRGRGPGIAGRTDGPAFLVSGLVAAVRVVDSAGRRLGAVPLTHVRVDGPVGASVPDELEQDADQQAHLGQGKTDHPLEQIELELGQVRLGRQLLPGGFGEGFRRRLGLGMAEAAGFQPLHELQGIEGNRSGHAANMARPPPFVHRPVAAAVRVHPVSAAAILVYHHATGE